ncbi:AAA family ATPase [Pseudomonas promysalinigenes]|uniref:DNA 3'-5' helicase n=1 Tax=Pseudomonas promysalinigenes TaxID=485898 RepID=A0ABY6AHU8_9PSED|nr:AAA family ATPase [Pseudomonas promysalinigenes]UXH38818.1 AAA family ATPase [Pseudomonas promysalinigenes]
MKALIDVVPTAEQLALFSRVSPGVEVIRGAAGSGKTTTALLKLRSCVAFYLNRARRQVNPKPVKVLVLTYNRTLRGYISELAEQQLPANGISLEISTFNKWARRLTDADSVLNFEETDQLLGANIAKTKLDPAFGLEESLYVLGRFATGQLDDYLAARREGRGSTPRMERSVRQVLLDKVIRPYIDYKEARGLVDWNDLACTIASRDYEECDVVVVDETQDFSANEIRALLRQCSPEASVTFVLDSAQRIYTRNFNWGEVGVTLRSEKSHRLQTNYRNTHQIARFASAMLDGLAIDDNGTMPNFNTARGTGPKPIVLKGEYVDQVSAAIDFLGEIDLEKSSVAFLHPKGWFRGLMPALRQAGYPFVELTGNSEWPQGRENIALCTIHSSKGLEFDHVIMIGLDGSVLDVDAPNEEEEGEEGGEGGYEPSARLRRLIAMGIGRARESVMIGFKPSDAPDIMRFVDDELYEGRDV